MASYAFDGWAWKFENGRLAVEFFKYGADRPTEPPAVAADGEWVRVGVTEARDLSLPQLSPDMCGHADTNCPFCRDDMERQRAKL